MLYTCSGLYSLMMLYNSSNWANKTGSFLSTSPPSPWSSISWKPLRALKPFNHCQEALKLSSDIESSAAICLALTMANEGETVKFAHHIASIQVWSLSSTSEKCPTDARNVVALFAADISEEHCSISALFSQILLTALSSTLYSRASDHLLGGFGFLSLLMISSHCCSFKCLPELLPSLLDIFLVAVRDGDCSKYGQRLQQYIHTTYVMSGHAHMRALTSVPPCYVRKSQSGSMCGLNWEVTVCVYVIHS